MNQNLLIIGAGGHGRVAKETALALGNFQKIAFLDDRVLDAIGKLDEYMNFKEEFSQAFVALGNNESRSYWYEKLTSAGFHLPFLIHPAAYVSPSAFIEERSIILPGAIVHTGVQIKLGCIVGIGALIDHDSTIEEFCHINTGAMVKAGSLVPKFSKIDTGTIFR